MKLQLRMHCRTCRYRPMPRFCRVEQLGRTKGKMRGQNGTRTRTKTKVPVFALFVGVHAAPAKQVNLAIIEHRTTASQQETSTNRRNRSTEITSSSNRRTRMESISLFDDVEFDLVDSATIRTTLRAEYRPG